MSEPTIELGGPSDRSETQVQLSVVAGPHAGTTWVFDRRTELILGRDRPAQLVLPDEPALSRSHLKLRISPPHVEFIDQQSRNGTQVNGVHVVSATLRDGDRLSVGQTELLLKTITSGADEAVGSLEETQATSERVNPAETTAPKQSDRSGGDDLFSHDGSDQKRSAGASRVGEDIGPYELIEVLGSGGMAIVYKAVHRRTRETVAVKLIRGDLPQSAKQMNLFVREARLLSQLHHPRIVKSIEFGIHDRHPYLAMEHIESLDLMELIDGYDAKRKLRISLWVISRALEALHYLHSQDIVHRDIKPSNILAYREGHRLQVKLADFGLAKLFVDAGFSGITNEKSVRGTLAYMSPEQFHRSRDAKPEDDLFSCGATLYRLLLGEFPNMLFKPDQTMERLQASTFPSNITNIIAKSISLKREERFLTVEDFAESVKSCRST